MTAAPRHTELAVIKILLELTLCGLKQHPSRGIFMLSKGEVREGLWIGAERSESLEVGISGTRMSVMEIGNGRGTLLELKCHGGPAPGGSGTRGALC